MVSREKYDYIKHKAHEWKERATEYEKELDLLSKEHEFILSELEEIQKVYGTVLTDLKEITLKLEKNLKGI